MTRTNLLFSALLGALTLLFTACSNDDDNNPALNVPENYDGSNFESNATVELQKLSELSALSSTMKAGRTEGTQVAESEMLSAFSPLEAITTSYYAGRIKGWFPVLAAASGNTFDYTTAPNNDGGVLGGYLFSPEGVEIEQLVEKGLFGAALYNHALTVKNTANFSAADVDKLVAIYGAKPTFANTDKTGDDKDIFAAKYAARRDKNDSEGLYRKAQAALIRAQAAAKAGENFNSERENAINDFLMYWEKSNAATVINYLHSTASKLSQTEVSPEDVGSALHAYGEAVGFLHGWRTLPAGERIITDAEIDEILVLMLAPQNATATSYLLAQAPFETLPQLTEAIEKLQGIYGFSDQEVEDFRKNWVSEQGR